MTKIEWTRKAIKQLAKIDTRAKVRLISAVGLLGNYKQMRSVKYLQNHQYNYRLRVGNYRVLFNVIEDSISVNTIEEVKNRDESAY